MNIASNLIVKKKILIILPTPIAVGDLMMMQSLFILLKMKNPEAVMDVLAASKTPELIARIPEVRKVIHSPLVHGKWDLSSRYRLGKSLRAENYDQAIVFSTSFKAGLVPWFARIPIRTGLRRKWGFNLLNDTQLLPRPRLPRMIQRFLIFGLKPGEVINEEACWPKISADQASLTQTIAKFQLVNDHKPILALCPGSTGGSSKRWPENYFSQLAEYFILQGWTVWCIGGPAEKEIIANINASLSKPTVDLGRTSLTEALDLMSLATVVVANDSGLMHIACALGRPVVALYGSGSPAFTPPLTRKAKVLYKSLSCQPCYQRECPLVHLNCLKQISVPEVINAVQALKEEFSEHDSKHLT